PRLPRREEVCEAQTPARRLPREGEAHALGALVVLIDDQVVALGLAREVAVSYARREESFALRAPFQLVVDGPDFFGDEGAVLLITSLPLLELPLPLEERSLVDEGEHLFERDVFDYARAVEGRARDGHVRVHVRARRVRSVADDGARGARAGGAAHAELRVFADEFFRLVRRGVGPLAARPGFRRRGLAVLRRRAVARAALQGVHDVQAVEGVLRVEERAFVERLQIFINVAAVERGPAENDGH